MDKQTDLKVLEVDDAVSPVLVRGPRERQRGLELAVPPHGGYQPLVQLSKQERVVLF